MYIHTPVHAYMQGYLHKQAAEDPQVLKALLAQAEEDEEEDTEEAAEETSTKRSRQAAPIIVRMERPQQYKSRTGAYLTSMLAPPIGSALYTATRSRDALNDAPRGALAGMLGYAAGITPGLVMTGIGAHKERPGLMVLGGLLAIAGAIAGTGEATYRATDAPHIRERRKTHVSL